MKELVRWRFRHSDFHERGGGLSGLSTGFWILTRCLDGLHAAEMIVIAARPSMGKPSGHEYRGARHAQRKRTGRGIQFEMTGNHWLPV